jgi:hypothetical protein
MTDIGVTLVIAFAFLASWVVRLVRAPNSLAWPVFILAVALLVLNLMDQVHVYVPSGIGQPLSWALTLAVIVRLATELFPRDRANLP